MVREVRRDREHQAARGAEQAHLASAKQADADAAMAAAQADVSAQLHSPTAPIDQVDVSGQWPLSGRWHVVGRMNYSFKDDASNLYTTTSSTNTVITTATTTGTASQHGRLIESIAGLEYNGGCWVVRAVVRRTALTADHTSTAFFIQLELNDFSSIGSNPLNILKRNIQGYSLINQPAADPIFGE